jgi:hypothetical protein
MSDKGEPVSSELGKRSRRSGWDVDEEPAKLTRSSSDLNISGTAVASIASVPPLMVSSASSAPLQQANTNFAAMTAQMLAQQVLAKSGLPTGVSAQQQAPKMENRIYVGSLPYSLKEPDVVALFSAFGPIVRCDMSYDLQLGRSKGFCFVEFHDPVTAQAAMAMDGFELAGRRVKSVLQSFPARSNRCGGAVDQSGQTQPNAQRRRWRQCQGNGNGVFPPGEPTARRGCIIELRPPRAAGNPRSFR